MTANGWRIGWQGAAIVGKAESSLSESKKAAEVMSYYFEKIRPGEFSQNNKIRPGEFMDKTKHLYEISKTERDLWLLLCEWLMSGENGKREVADIVDEVKQLKSDHAFLQPYEKVVSRYGFVLSCASSNNHVTTGALR
jgi:hypothetical protein